MRKACCTIITSNYFFYAKALYDSLDRLNTGTSFHVLVVDEMEHPLSYKDIVVHSLSEVKQRYPEDYGLIEKYEIDKESKLRWALKPLLLKFLLEEKAYEKSLFFDPDLYFFQDPTFLFELLDKNNVILTPHWRSSKPELDSVNFDLLFNGGIYNAGFFGCNAKAIHVLEWWLRGCSYKMSKEDGYFVDQTFLNLMPVYFAEDVTQINHKGCNVSSWNTIECQRTLNNGKVLINDTYPVVFIHFTNVTIKRIAKGDDHLLQPLLATYRENLVAHKPDFKFKYETVVPTSPKKTKSSFVESTSDSQFINIPLTTKTLDRYWVRTSLFKAVKAQIPHFKGDLLDAGCGKMPYREFLLENSEISSYTGLDIEAAIQYDSKIKPDLYWDGKTMPIKDSTYHTVIATEVLEHCPDPEQYLAEVYRVLKPGGTFFFTVPFLWPLHEVPHDAYRYTPFTLERMFNEVGFKKISIKSLGGYNSSLAVMIGLWVNRHLRNSWKKRMLQRLSIPVVKWLVKRDIPPKHWNEGTMSTGFYGTMVK